LQDKEEAKSYYAKKNSIEIRKTEFDSSIDLVEVFEIANIPFTKNPLKDGKETEEETSLIDPKTHNRNNYNNTDSDVIELEDNPLAVDVDLGYTSSSLNMSASTTTTTSSTDSPAKGYEDQVKIDITSLFKRRKSQSRKVAKKNNKSKDDISRPTLSFKRGRKSKRSPKSKSSPDSGVEIIIEDSEENCGRLLSKTERKKGVNHSDDSGKKRDSNYFADILVLSPTKFAPVQRRPIAGKDKVTFTN